jgi:hypothetical protein
MKHSLKSILFATFLFLVGLAGCEKKKIPSVPASPGNVVRGDFITEPEMIAARKAAQVNHEACAKWCGGPISRATDNPQKIGCSEARCKELYEADPPKKLFRHCEGTDCNSCNRYADTYYSVNCDETLDGCIVMFSSMSKCE